MKSFRTLSYVVLAIPALLSPWHKAHATALPAGLYDPKDCGSSTPCFTISDTNAGAAAVGIKAVVGPSSGSGAGTALLGQSVSGVGTYGYALTGSGVTGSTFSGIGVTGKQTDAAVASVGVLGTSVIGEGVKGTSGGGWPHA